MVSRRATEPTFSYMYIPDTWNHEKHQRRGSDHPCDITGLGDLVSNSSARIGPWEAHIVEDVEIGVQGIASSHIGAIVRDLDSIVERVEIDATI